VILIAPGQGILAGGIGHEFLNNRVHDNGRVFHLTHGVYWGVKDGLIDGNEIWNNAAYGIQVYGDGDISGNRVIGNRIHHNTRLGNGGGINLSGPNNRAYNNVIWGQDASYAINIAWKNPQNNRVEHNTIVNRYCIDINDDSVNAIVRNNLCVGANATIDNRGTGTQLSNNLLSDPQFVDAAGANFRLKPTSPAIDAGVTIADVMIDAARQPRPQGLRSDIGAYEFSATTPPPPPPPVDVCVTAPLTLSVSRWPAGTTGSRSFTYRTNRPAQVTVNLLVMPWRAIAVDARDCVATVTR
jgi:hypothetical protein